EHDVVDAGEGLRLDATDLFGGAIVARRSVGAQEIAQEAETFSG
ncbi:MAG: hypothetical protein QOH15_2141, partial [Gaiellales bacterium]|nr:hypothetical protein [Gaiellales bacterium]